MPENRPSGQPAPTSGRRELLAQQPWIVFLLPMIVYMLVGVFEPKPDGAEEGIWIELGIEYEHYPVVYTVKIALTLLAMVAVAPGYREFAFRVTPWAVVVGVLGGVAWIALALWQVEEKLLASIRLDWLVAAGERSAFNPREQLADSPRWMIAFLAVRLFGLVVVIAIVEEMFLRGLLMRFVVQPDWWNVPFGVVTRTSIVVGTVAPMLLHPGELLAAAVWFSAVTWLMTRTRTIWDCVVAHAITNGILGGYVIYSGHWRLM